MNNKAEIATLTIIIVGVLVASAGSSYVAYDQGYIPWIEQPTLPSDYTDDSQSIPELPCEDFFNYVKETIPSVEGVKYELYRVGTSPSLILLAYKTELEEKGYEIYEYNGDKIYGNTEISFESYSYDAYYGLFIKGITVVAVVAVAEETDETTTRQGSCVLYAVGDVWRFGQVGTELKDMGNIGGIIGAYE